MHYIKVSFLFLFIFSFTIKCLPQSDSVSENYNHAIQIYIVNQAIAAYKYQFNENSAIRFTLNVTGLFNNKKAEHVEYRDRRTDTLGYFENRELTTSNQFYEIKLQYLYQTKIHKFIQLYFGGGPFANYQYSQYEEWYQSVYSNSEEIHKGYYQWNDDTWKVGISALIGLECTIYDFITLFSEYEVNVSRGWQNNDYFANNQTWNSNNYDYDIWTYELKGLRVGIGIYF